MEDISDFGSIKILVDAFCNKVRNDQVLGPVFFAAIEHNWQPHLEKMYAFWYSALFGGPDCESKPFARHAQVPVGAGHYKWWTKLFEQTIDEHFEGTKASEIKAKAGLMSMLFQCKLSAKKESTKALL